MTQPEKNPLAALFENVFIGEFAQELQRRGVSLPPNYLEMLASSRDETVHACPPSGEGLTPCCGKSPFDLPRTDHITMDPALVTCTTSPAAEAPEMTYDPAGPPVLTLNGDVPGQMHRVHIARSREDGRPTFDALYLAVAGVLALAGDCKRRQVGAFIVTPDHRPVGMGYNGVESGRRGCLDGACPRATSNVAPYAPYDDCVAIHAEMNAIARSWASLEGTTMYVTEKPCDSCYKAIRAARIARVIVP